MFLDLKLAARRLAATPLFTAFAVVSLAAGVGVTTAVYSVVDTLFLQDRHVAVPERVAHVVWPRAGRFVQAAVSLPDFHDLRQAQPSFSTLSASGSFRTTVTTPSTNETVTAEAVDGAYFSTLGVGASIGRLIAPVDDDGRAPVAVLSRRLWRSWFAANPAIVGGTIRIAGQTFEIVGVAEASFDGPGMELFATALWIPLSTRPLVSPPSSEAFESRGQRVLRVFGRLAPEATIAAAASELTRIAATLDGSYPPPQHLSASGQSERAWSAKSIAELAADAIPARRLGLVLAAFVALVLAVACTNLANLILARGTTRQQELAVRHALGASRGRLVREQCAESLILAGAGAIASYFVFRGLQLLMTTDFNFQMPMGGRWTLSIRPELDGTALAMAVVSLAISLMVFGLEPALELTRSRDLHAALARTADGGGPSRTARHRLLLRWQVAVSAGFFIVATMFVKYSIAEARHDSGVDLDRLAVGVINVQRFDPARIRRFVDRVIESARTDPAIDALSISTGMPFGVAGAQALSLVLPGQLAASENDHAAAALAVTPPFFRTVGIPILRGRGFDDRDLAAPDAIVVLNEHAANRVFGSPDVVGRQVIVRRQGAQDTLTTVVGVVRNTDAGAVVGDARRLAYFPLREQPGPVLVVAARSTAGAGRAVQSLRQLIRGADLDIAPEVVGSGRGVLASVYVFLRAMGGTALALGALTLVLAMVGLFGIQSHIVSNRTREIGVRMSFGASAGEIQRMILKDGSLPVAQGLVLGLLIGLAGRGIVRWYMEIDVAIVDPWMLIVAPIPLVLAGFCAGYLPARRAASIDPNVALRHL
jgi:predicted permease